MQRCLIMIGLLFRRDEGARVRQRLRRRMLATWRLLPFDFGAQETAYIDQYLPSFLDRNDSVTILTRGNFSSQEWMSWLSPRVISRGFHQVSHSHFRMVETIVFQK